MTEPRVGRAACVLGFAGLLPQVLALALILLARRGVTDLAGLLTITGFGLAMLYGALILSFLGGIWWGFAMRRQTGQATLAAIAVLPSLVALGCVAVALGDMPGPPSPWPAIVLGSGILLTLIVDRRLVRSGEAPPGWMALRTPLSTGLGALTIAAGLFVAF